MNINQIIPFRNQGLYFFTASKNVVNYLHVFFLFFVCFKYLFL